MAYVPNPADPTQPTDAIIAETAQAEFRALKSYIAALVGLPVGQQLGGFKNRIINGDIRIDQVNAGGAVVINAAQLYAADQWGGYGTVAAGVFSLQQLAATPPAGFKNYLRATVTTPDAAPAVGSTYGIFNKVEGLNVIDFQLGQAGAISFTLGLQMRSSLTGQLSGVFRNAAINRSYPWTCNILAANTWTAVSVTVAGDLAGAWAIDNTAGLEMVIDMGSGATYKGVAGAWSPTTLFGVTGSVNIMATNGATLDITGVQIEKGAIATPFEYRDYQSELARCQRYLPAIFNSSAAETIGAGWHPFTNQSSFFVPFKVPTRVPATAMIVSSATHFTVSDSSGANAMTSMSLTDIGSNGARVSSIVAGNPFTTGFGCTINTNTVAALMYFTGARL